MLRIYTSRIYPLPWPNSVTSIGEYAFSGCSGLTSVTIKRAIDISGRKHFRQSFTKRRLSCQRKWENGEDD